MNETQANETQTAAAGPFADTAVVSADGTLVGVSYKTFRAHGSGPCAEAYEVFGEVFGAHDAGFGAEPARVRLIVAESHAAGPTCAEFETTDAAAVALAEGMVARKCVPAVLADRLDELRELLGERYEHRPELGGRKAIAPDALARLVREAKEGRRVVLMCQEHAPGECHRHHAIGAPLAAAAVTVWHLFDGEVISAADLQAAFDADDDGYDCYQFADVFGCAPPAKGART